MHERTPAGHPSHQLADQLLGLARLSFRLGRVPRITYHPDGVTPETDTDHTVMLGLVACAVADAYLPHLDRGLVAELALVHDVVEAYAGDTPTLRMLTHIEKVQKRAREDAAWRRIDLEFQALPWLPDMIAAYDAQGTPEARYVRAVDKVVPKLAHVLNDASTLLAQGLTPDEVRTRYQAQAIELAGYAADFPVLLQVRAELVERMLAALERRRALAAELVDADDGDADSNDIAQIVDGSSAPRDYPSVLHGERPRRQP